ncbi:uncharacterized protein LOC130725407 [Lotus japonicus]|uniref:uncharacterized protein LOC130725407 n=1 Tax=Lotus japonicus TaxID=34305 RepID=UPI002584E6FA|nr:uncharacterized protein LOC130725407 [Lotus japonicus]
MARNNFFNLFFNPFTKEVKQLAYGPEECRNIPCVGFSHPLTSPECVVIELHHTSDDMTVYMTRLGKKEWEEFSFEDCYFCFVNVSPCFHNGAFYYLNNKGELGIFKVVGEEDILWEEIVKPLPPFEISLYKIDPGGYYKCFLVECNGSLLLVFECAFGNWVQVFKLDESKMTWLQVESLENWRVPRPGVQP